MKLILIQNNDVHISLKVVKTPWTALSPCDYSQFSESAYSGESAVTRTKFLVTIDARLPATIWITGRCISLDATAAKAWSFPNRFGRNDRCASGGGFTDQKFLSKQGITKILPELRLLPPTEPPNHLTTETLYPVLPSTRFEQEVAHLLLWIIKACDVCRQLQT